MSPCVVIVGTSAAMRSPEVLCESGIDAAAFLVDDGIFETLASLDASLLLVESERIDSDTRKLCIALRECSPTPILLLHGHATESEILAVLDCGVDVTLTDSVGVYELVARVRSLLRRAPKRKPIDSGESVAVGAVVLDLAARRVQVRGTTIPMPRREFDIAAILMQRAGTVVTREDLLRELWTGDGLDSGSEVQSKSLDVQVGRVRALISDALGHSVILTVRGIGYRFLGPDEMPPPLTKDFTRSVRIDATLLDLTQDEVLPVAASGAGER